MTEIVIAKDVVRDHEIVKIVDTDPDPDHAKGTIVGQEKMNLAKDGVTEKTAIVEEKKIKRIAKEAKIQCRLKKLTKCVLRLVYRH